MSKHIITVDIGAGLEQIEVDDQLLVRIRLAASSARLQREREQRERDRNAYRSYGDFSFADNTFTFTDGTFTFTAESNPYEHLFGQARQAAGDHPYESARQGERAEEPTRPASPRTTNEALGVLRHYVGGDTHMFISADVLRKSVRRAKRKAHPDTGGSNADFQLVSAAEQILRSAGRI